MLTVTATRAKCAVAVRRVPHIGLTYVGFLLLTTSFARLALNPFVISDYGRSGTPIFNWYLYTYGIVSVCLLSVGICLRRRATCSGAATCGRCRGRWV